MGCGRDKGKFRYPVTRIVVVSVLWEFGRCVWHFCFVPGTVALLVCLESSTIVRFKTECAVGVTAMTYIEHVESLRLRAAALVLAGLYLFGSGFWSNEALAQQTPRELRYPIQRNRIQPPPAPEPAPPSLAPVALPVTNPESALGSTLASCDQASGNNSELLALPGQRGEVQLDRCFRGRDHLVCSFNALLTEARLLLQDYKRIVDAEYPNIGNVDGICQRKPDRLTADLQSAMEFTARFKALKAEYESRSYCATRVQLSFREVAFPDMPQGPSILKSMIEAIESDLRGLSAVQVQVTELSGSIEVSQRAIVAIQKLHRSICATTQRAGSEAEGRASR